MSEEMNNTNEVEEVIKENVEKTTIPNFIIVYTYPKSLDL